MKKLFFIICIAIVVAPAFSADFGVTVDSDYSIPYTTGEAYDQSAVAYKVKASLWANASINQDMSFEFQGGYTYTESRNFFLELDQLQYSGKFGLPGDSSGILGVKAGRLSFSDFSAKVFAHKGDGLILDVGFPGLSVSIFGACTGLLQMPSNSIVMTASDLDASIVDPVPFWGPLGIPRVIEGVTITFPELFAGQSLILSGIFQQDLWSDSDLVEGGSTMNTVYAGLGLVGPLPIVDSLFYTVYGYGNTGWYGEHTIMAFLAGAGINYLMPAFMSSRLALDFLYSSGDSDHDTFYEGNVSGYSTAFVPVTPAPAGIVFTDQQTNLFYVSGSFSMKPFSGGSADVLKNTLILLKPTGFFRSTVGPLSASSVKADETGLYLGTEIDLILMARLFSDLGFSINGGIFLPSSIMEEPSPRIKATAALSLSI